MESDEKIEEMSGENIENIENIGKIEENIEGQSAYEDTLKVESPVLYLVSLPDQFTRSDLVCN